MTQCNWVAFNCLLIVLFHTPQERDDIKVSLFIRQCRVSEAFNGVSGTDIDDMREAHDAVVVVVKRDIPSMH